MDFARLLRSTRTQLEREIRRQRSWKTYVVAVGMTFCFFFMVQSVLGEDNEPDNEVPPPSTQARDQKVENFKLADEPVKASVWEKSTGASIAGAPPAPSAPPADQADQAEPVADQVAMVPDQEKPAPALEEATQPKAEPSEDPVDAAAKVAQDFYTALNDADSALAYDQLGLEFQAFLPYERFQDGYRSVETIRAELKRGELLSDDRVRLDLQLEVTELGVPTTYLATCVVSKDYEDWKISGIAQLATAY